MIWYFWNGLCWLTARETRKTDHRPFLARCWAFGSWAVACRQGPTLATVHKKNSLFHHQVYQRTFWVIIMCQYLVLKKYGLSGYFISRPGHTEGPRKPLQKQGLDPMWHRFAWSQSMVVIKYEDSANLLRKKMFSSTLLGHYVMKSITGNWFELTTELATMIMIQEK